MHTILCDTYEYKYLNVKACTNNWCIVLCNSLLKYKHDKESVQQSYRRIQYSSRKMCAPVNDQIQEKCCF